MGILQRIFTKASSSRQPFMSTVFSRSPFAIGSQVSKGLYEFKNWVYACVSARAEGVADIDLYLYDTKRKERIESHELLDLIYRVNDGMTKFELFESTQAFKDLDGNAFWFLARDRDGKGKIQAIYPLRPDKVNIVTNKENGLVIDGYVYTSQDGTKVPFSKNEILHFKNFNPLGNHPFPHRGLGIVQASAWSIDTDNEVRKWNYNFFKNSAKPDGILYSEGGAVDQTDYNRLREQWKQEHQGSENSGKIAILSGGIKWQELTRSQKDMDFVEQRNFNRDEILALFKTPKSILGLTEGIIRANADATIYIFALRTIKPAMQRIVDTLNEFLVPEFGEGIEFRFTSPVPDDRAQTLSEYSLGVNKWLTRNEIRTREGLPSSEEGDKFYGSSLDQVVDQLPPEPKPQKASPKKAKAVEKPESEKTATEKAIDSFVAKMPKPKQERKSVEKSTEYLAEWKRLVEDNTAPLKAKLVKFFDAQKAEVLANVKDELKGLTAKEYRFKGVAEMLFDEADALKSSISMITPFIRQYLNDSGKRASALVDGTFDSSASGIDAFIADRAKYFAETINATTSDELFASIKEGIDAGETLESISERVSEVYGKATDFRTDMIARTEVSASSNFGAIEAYRQAGVDGIEWKVVNPQDDDCLMNEGVTVKVGEAFPSGDAYPPVHPNCVCTTIPVFND
jgi:HK97 family phage portal protein